MKHFKICIIIFLSIVITSIFSYVYIRTQAQQIYISLEKYCNIQTINENDNISIKSIKNRFMDKKNMLQFFVNKEHIKELEIYILLIEDSIRNKDIQACRQNSIQALVTLNTINDYSVAID